MLQIQYRVKWSNYSASENAWVNEEHMYKCDNLIRSFERSNFVFIVGEYSCFLLFFSNGTKF